MTVEDVLGQMAVDKGFITPSQLQRARQAVRQTGGKRSLPDVLVAQGLITPSQLKNLQSVLSSAPTRNANAVARTPRKAVETQKPRSTAAIAISILAGVVLIGGAMAFVLSSKKEEPVAVVKPAPRPEFSQKQKQEDPKKDENVVKKIEPSPEPQPQPQPKKIEDHDNKKIEDEAREKIAKGSWEQMLADADALVNSAKGRYESLSTSSASSRRGEQLREALDETDRARTYYQVLQDYVPEEKREEVLEKAKVTVQLMRMLRDRLKQEGSGNVVKKTPTPEPKDETGPESQAALEGVVEAFRVFLKNPRAGGLSLRDSALDARVQAPAARALLNAFALVGSKVASGDWSISGAEGAALQKYLQAFNPASFVQAGMEQHATALQTLLTSLRIVKEGEPWTLRLLVWAHMDVLSGKGGSGALLMEAATATGLTARSGGYGTTEGFALREARRALDQGDPEKALETLHRVEGSSEFAVKYVRAMAMVLQSIVKQADFDKAVAMWAQWSVPAFAEAHRKAIHESLRKFLPCQLCKGSGQRKCRKCNGVGKLVYKCAKCGGSGIKPATSSCCTGCCEKHKGQTYSEPGCRGVGIKEEPCSPTEKCPSCKEPWRSPTVPEVFKLTPCKVCGGQASPFDRVAVPCANCFGLGEIATPASDPSKVLEHP